MADAESTSDAGTTYVHIDGEYHIVVKLKKKGTVIEFDGNDQDCNDAWGYTIIGREY